MTGTSRKPAAFKVAADPVAEELTDLKPSSSQRKRQAKALDTDLARITPEQDDPFLREAMQDQVTPVPPVTRRGLSLGSLLMGALGILFSLALAMWIDGLVRNLFTRADWLGWFALGMAALAGIALLGIIIREILALRRLSSIAELQAASADALVHKDMGKAQAVVLDLQDLLKDKPQLETGRSLLKRQRNEIIDGPDLLRLAETDLLGPLDEEASRMVSDAAKRVSVVTAVSPRALVDVGYVLFEASRLVRNISATYGGRPGTLGFFRLARSVIAHLAVTGTLAATDSIVGQLLGHGVASRISARLGEGVVNGIMTARIGIAAMEACRPMPFSALARPGMGDFIATVVRFTRSKQQDTD